MGEEKVSVGRIVRYRGELGDVFPAIVQYVHSDTCVDLHVFGPHDGTVYMTSVLLTGEDTTRFGVPGWYWPPREV